LQNDNITHANNTNKKTTEQQQQKQIQMYKMQTYIIYHTTYPNTNTKQAYRR